MFISEDDLFIADREGCNPRRIVSNMGVISDPHFYPEGNGIAFKVLRGAGNSVSEIFTCGLFGENLTQLTFFASMNTGIAGWKSSDELIVYSDVYEAHRGSTQFYTLNLTTGKVSQEKYGYGHSIQITADGILLGRNTFEVPYWKNYRGGTRGKLWFKPKQAKAFKPILDMETGIHSQYLYKGYIYFVTDRDGEANVYSYSISNNSLKQLTTFDLHGVRTMGHYEDTLIFTVAGKLWTYQIGDGNTKQLNLNMEPQGKRNAIKFVDSDRDMGSSPFPVIFDEENIGIIMRGRGILIGKNRDNPIYLNRKFKGRIRVITRVSDELFACISEINGEDGITTYSRNGTLLKEYPVNKGILMKLKNVPGSRQVVFTNNRYEMFLMNLDDGKMSCVEKGEAGRLSEFDISHDGKLIAYSFPVSSERSQIRIYEIATGKKVEATSDASMDYSPSFDFSGKYLNFISNRNLDPTYDRLFFSLGFMTISKPYSVTLCKDLKNPFIGELPTFPEEKDDSVQVTYDLDGIEKRIQPFPLETGNYEKIISSRGKSFYLKSNVEGSMKYYSLGPSHKGRFTLMEFDMATRQERVVHKEVSDFSISQKGDKLMIETGGKLIISGLDLRNDEADLSRKEFSLKSIHENIDTYGEFTQMFNETWKVMREGYWNPEKLNNWEKVREKYAELLPLIQTRSELSDILKKMQGELGTSHSYEMPSRITDVAYFSSGRLGAMFEDTEGGVVIRKIYRGDPANEGEKSPLESSGMDVREGDIIIALDNVSVQSSMDLNRLLLNKGDDLALLSIKSDDGKEKTNVIKLLPNQKKLMYRDWVENRRAYVHEKSKGTCGYIHIPDMGPAGYAEFFRLLSQETEYANLIVDVRYNGGGHVSSILLGMLNRRQIGKDVQRWGKPEPYPQYSITGKMACVTNEFAGSDGDIFSHSWKLMKLGALIGTRTWGGVVGINPIGTLIDGTVVTQPEYAFHFDDVGFGVENYGTDPTIEVEVTPEEFAEEKDPQLDMALKILKA
jgi:Uncharacterized protein related to the periplasmic component of the Tol biopolymer transport system